MLTPLQQNDNLMKQQSNDTLKIFTKRKHRPIPKECRFSSSSSSDEDELITEHEKNYLHESFSFEDVNHDDLSIGMREAFSNLIKDYNRSNQLEF